MGNTWGHPQNLISLVSGGVQVHIYISKIDFTEIQSHISKCLLEISTSCPTDTYNTYKTFQPHVSSPTPAPSLYSQSRKSPSHHPTTQPPSYPSRKLWRHPWFLPFPHPTPTRVSQHQVSCIFTQHLSNFPKFSVYTANSLVYVHHPLYIWKILLFSLYLWNDPPLNY